MKVPTLYAIAFIVFGFCMIALPLNSLSWALFDYGIEDADIVFTLTFVGLLGIIAICFLLHPLNKRWHEEQRSKYL